MGVIGEGGVRVLIVEIDNRLGIHTAEVARAIALSTAAAEAVNLTALQGGTRCTGT